MNAQELSGQMPHKFDLIILNHVLEHMLDLKSELVSIKNLLSADGILYIGVPGIKIERDFLAAIQNAHIRYFSLGTLRQVLAWNGFQMISGNEEIRAIFKAGRKGKKQIHNYYEENKKYLLRTERKNFLFIHVRKPLSRIQWLHRLYERIIRRDRKEVYR